MKDFIKEFYYGKRHLHSLWRFCRPAKRILSKYPLSMGLIRGLYCYSKQKPPLPKSASRS